MHTLGKVLTWLIVVVALVAIIFTSKVISYRNAWTRQVEDLKKQNRDNATQLVQKRSALRKRQAAFDRVMLGWDRYWTGIDTTGLNNPPGSLRAGFGKNQGFGVRPDGTPTAELPTAYAFRLNRDGTPVFVGSFQAVDVRENQSKLKPAWFLRQRANRIPGKWRFRTLIPPSFSGQFTDINTELTETDQRLSDANQMVTDQDKLDKLAQQRLNDRLRELQGNGGLVQKISGEESARGQALAKLDHLRRLLREARLLRDRLILDNNRLADSLPKPVAAQLSKK